MEAAEAAVPLETSSSFLSMGGRSGCRRCRCHICSIWPFARERRRLARAGGSAVDPKVNLQCNMWRLLAMVSVIVIVVLGTVLGFVLLFRDYQEPDVSTSHPVLVTGATGRTGAIIYGNLKARGVPVRAFVRNATKAREMLGCSACDTSEGIFVGDVMDPESFKPATEGASVLIITTSSSGHPGGGSPEDVDWTGALNQLDVFSRETADRVSSSMVMLISTMGTTMMDPPGVGAEVVHYKLNFEAELMASGQPFFIVKPCGLTNSPARQKELVVGHRDTLYDLFPPLISRGDVARVLVAGLVAGGGLRFDICSQAGVPTDDGDLQQLLSDARYHWEA